MSKEISEEMKEYLKREMDHIEAFGRQFIIPGREEDWKKLCETNKENTIEPLDVRIVRQLTEAMALISKGTSYEDVVKYCQSQIAHSPHTESWLTYQIAKYHPKGAEYARNDKLFMCTFDYADQIAALEKENTALLSTSRHSTK